MLRTGFQSLRLAGARQPLSCEASTSRRAWQMVAAAAPVARRSVHASVARREEADTKLRDERVSEAGGVVETEAAQEAAVHAPSAFSMPTLLPDEALPQAFRAAQTESGAGPSPFNTRNVYGQRREPHRLHVLATRNNTIMTLTTSTGDILLRSSSGALGFRNAARSSYDAGYRVALHMFERIQDNRVGWQVARLELIWNGFGQGREAVYRAILSNEGGQIRSLVTKMSDNTPLKVGGTRPKKRRML